eukprot:CAMPEP_0119261744 /NCGR_PEP_ID=MMETSP1329-20130426/1693_1 /TAXON_ID=114041 /ORGANISM="Genus nov. species nov., Strain RCC1024" /LENGTH=219 /DNA_ID=CAMNT_0007261325 /DNA_START=162 /DNA_END=817 /DNA_ORIENTATION=-
MASKKQLAKAAEIEKRLAALDGPEWDSDDEAEAAPAPKKAKKEAAPKAAKAEKRKKAKEPQSRVIYVGHVPHGFYEDQMRGFFSQFGDVTNLRLSRSKRTGASKGYAFVEFADPDVARIAAATMDKYLMHGKQLVAHVAPLELATKPQLFKGSDKLFLPRNGGKAHREASQKIEKDVAKTNKARKRTEGRKRKKLAEEFPGYDFPGVVSSPAAAAEEAP